jgi:hypothetical protein
MLLLLLSFRFFAVCYRSSLTHWILTTSIPVVGANDLLGLLEGSKTKYGNKAALRIVFYTPSQRNTCQVSISDVLRPKLR